MGHYILLVDFWRRRVSRRVCILVAEFSHHCHQLDFGGYPSGSNKGKETSVRNKNDEVKHILHLAKKALHYNIKLHRTVRKPSMFGIYACFYLPKWRETTHESCGAEVSSQALVLSSFYALKDGHSFSKMVLVVDNPTEMCWRGFWSHLWVWQLRKPVPKSCWTNFTGNMLRLDYSLAEKLICFFLPWDGFLYESKQRSVIKDSEEKMV